jgi:hypothetical protein
VTCGHVITAVRAVNKVVTATRRRHAELSTGTGDSVLL